MTNAEYGPFGRLDPLRGWYDEKVRNNRDEKLRLVRDQPDIAERMFLVFEDWEIGEMYVKERPHDPATFHISRALGIHAEKDTPERRADDMPGSGEGMAYRNKMEAAIEDRRRFNRKGT